MNECVAGKKRTQPTDFRVCFSTRDWYGDELRSLLFTKVAEVKALCLELFVIGR